MTAADNEITLLQCPNCLHVKEWMRSKEAAPGSCTCKSRRHWNVIKERPKQVRGFVRVHSIYGSQDLKGPWYQEDSTAWKKLK
jgi:hypothetical protein